MPNCRGELCAGNKLRRERILLETYPLESKAQKHGSAFSGLSATVVGHPGNTGVSAG